MTAQVPGAVPSGIAPGLFFPFQVLAGFFFL
jgi:hypothetical protein